MLSIYSLGRNFPNSKATMLSIKLHILENNLSRWRRPFTGASVFDSGQVVNVAASTLAGSCFVIFLNSKIFLYPCMKSIPLVLQLTHLPATDHDGKVRELESGERNKSSLSFRIYTMATKITRYTK